MSETPLLVRDDVPEEALLARILPCCPLPLDDRRARGRLRGRGRAGRPLRRVHGRPRRGPALPSALVDGVRRRSARRGAEPRRRGVHGRAPCGARRLARHAGRPAGRLGHGARARAGRRVHPARCRGRRRRPVRRGPGRGRRDRPRGPGGPGSGAARRGPCGRRRRARRDPRTVRRGSRAARRRSPGRRRRARRRLPASRPAARRGPGRGRRRGHGDDGRLGRPAARRGPGRAGERRRRRPRHGRARRRPFPAA